MHLGFNGTLGLSLLADVGRRE